MLDLFTFLTPFGETVLGATGYFFILTAPFWLFLILVPTLRSTWLYWRRWKFFNTSKYITLEMRIPREINKTPMAMDQVLQAIHAGRNTPLSVKDEYVGGETTHPVILEMVSFSGEVHFYIRFYHKLRNHIEASFFAYYPDVELIETEDHTANLPKNMKEVAAMGYKMWGTELILAREDAYPIKSYKDFESPDDESKFDPISTFLEVFNKLQAGEFIGLQFILRGADETWTKKWDTLVESLKEKEPVKYKQGDRDVFYPRTTSEIDKRTLTAVEQNLSKPAFETTVRLLYFAPKTMFYDSYPRRAVIGALNQYSALNLNSIKMNVLVGTPAFIWFWPYVFPGIRTRLRYQKNLFNYRNRMFPLETFMGKLVTSHPLDWNFKSKSFHMNTESLATIFHPPTNLVLTAPHVRKVDSRKAGPQVGLKIFGDEEEIKKYQ